MQTLISVIMPVFILIGFGYLAAWRGYFSASNVDGLMRFCHQLCSACVALSSNFNARSRCRIQRQPARQFLWRSFHLLLHRNAWGKVLVRSRLGGRHRNWLCLPLLKFALAGPCDHGTCIWFRQPVRKLRHNLNPRSVLLWAWDCNNGNHAR